MSQFIQINSSGLNSTSWELERRQGGPRLYLVAAAEGLGAAQPMRRASPMKGNTILSAQQLSQPYYEQLLVGDRLATRNLIETALHQGITPRDLLTDLVWPTMEILQGMYREDRITITQLNLATRLNRSITDQLTCLLPREANNGKTVLILCGDDEPEELGGQICADLFESRGYTVRFAGGGVPNDEVLKLIGEVR